MYTELVQLFGWKYNFINWTSIVEPTDELIGSIYEQVTY